jgi:Zn-dependent protease
MRILGIPVSIDLSFFVLVTLLAWQRTSQPVLLVQWIVVVLVSVILHELGHALVARGYGYAPSIRLYGMGGLTSWHETTPAGPARRIAISLAGPFAGFAVGALATALFFGVPALRGPEYQLLYHDIAWVNLGWGVLNLVPILPLDGGNVLRSAIELLTRRPGDLPARVVSVVLALAACVAALGYGMPWVAFLAAFFGAANVGALVESWRESEDSAVVAALEEGIRLVEAGKGGDAVETLAGVSARARARSTKRRAAEALVYACLQSGDVQRARRAYGELVAFGARDPSLEGLLALESGDAGGAIAALEPVYAARPSGAVGRALCRALVRAGHDERAFELCGRPESAPFAAELLDGIAAEAFVAGRHDLAARAWAGAAEASAEPMLAYNAGCAFARAGRPDEALEWLDTAARRGFSNAELAASDEDLASLRGRPELAAFLAAIEPRPSRSET